MTSSPSTAVTVVVGATMPTDLAQQGSATNGGTVEITGTGDADGDMITLYNGTTMIGSGTAGLVVGVGDFYGNDADDILFRDDATGAFGQDNASKQHEIAIQQHLNADKLDAKASALDALGHSLEHKAVEMVGETEVVPRGR